MTRETLANKTGLGCMKKVINAYALQLVASINFTLKSIQVSVLNGNLRSGYMYAVLAQWTIHKDSTDILGPSISELNLRVHVKVKGTPLLHKNTLILI